MIITDFKQKTISHFIEKILFTSASEICTEQRSIIKFSKLHKKKRYALRFWLVGLLLCSGAGGLGAIPFADRLKIMADDRSIPRHQSRVRHGGERHGARSH